MNRKEALRYLANAKDLLRTSLIEDNRYVDEKYVKSGCGIAYLCVLKAIDGNLIRNGVSRKALPKKVEEYEKALKEYASPPMTANCLACSETYTTSCTSQGITGAIFIPLRLSEGR